VHVLNPEVDSLNAVMGVRSSWAASAIKRRCAVLYVSFFSNRVSIAVTNGSTSTGISLASAKSSFSESLVATLLVRVFNGLKLCLTIRVINNGTRRNSSKSGTAVLRALFNASSALTLSGWATAYCSPEAVLRVM